MVVFRPEPGPRLKQKPGTDTFYLPIKENRIFKKKNPDLNLIPDPVPRPAPPPLLSGLRQFGRVPIALKQKLYCLLQVSVKDPLPPALILIPGF